MIFKIHDRSKSTLPYGFFIELFIWKTLTEKNFWMYTND